MSKITHVAPGSYRTPLVAGLRALGALKLADAVESGSVKLGIAAQRRSNDQDLPECCTACLRALDTPEARALAEPAVLRHYHDRLESGAIYVAVPGAPLAAQIHYAPGELFFRS